MRKYRDKIDPQLRHIARKIPFTEKILRMAEKPQTLMLKATPVPRELFVSTYKIQGYNNLEFPIEVYESAEDTRKKPCLFYIHGGGFGYKAAPYHKKLACIYASKADCKVVFPDYHRLPEYPYPAAAKDVLAVYEWVCKHAVILGIDTAHIAIAGDSAGGALAAGLCRQIEEKELPKPCFQMLVYPVTDARMQTASMDKYIDTPLWNAKNNDSMWKMYLKNVSDVEKSQASPMQAELPIQIPDTYIEVAEIDCLHDEGVAYGKRLRAAGANVKIHETKGTIHGYDNALKSDVAKKNIRCRIAVLRKHFWDC